MVIEGEFHRLGVLLTHKCYGGFNRQFRACPAVGRTPSPISDKDCQEGRFSRIGFNLRETTILAVCAGRRVGGADR